jgi:hypothetical protein
VLPSENTAFQLIALDGLEERAEVSLAERPVIFSLDNFDEDGAHQIFRK